MKVSKTGYKRNSKDKNEPALKIPSNNITMKGVDFPVFGISNTGHSQMMYPGMDYLFPGSSVYEIPMAQDGTQTNTLEADLISKILMQRNRDKDFVQRAYALGENPDTRMFTMFDPENFGQQMSHKMAWGEDDLGQTYMFPTVMNPGNEAIKVPNQYADYISSVGYKKATGMPTEAYGGDPSIPDLSNRGWLSKYQDAGAVKEGPTTLPVEVVSDKPAWAKDRESLTPDETNWYETFNFKNWGVNDYSNYSSFNSAFRNAKESGEDEFIWNNKRYHTKLAPKEVSDTYFDSKKFLQDYYSTEPFFKPDTSTYGTMTAWEDYTKDKYGKTWGDYYDKIKNTPEYQNFENPKHSAIIDTLNMLSEPIFYSKFPQEAKDYINQNIRNKYLQSLNDPSYYFSITSEPNPEDPVKGYQDTKNKKFYVSNTSSHDKFHTTSVHELSHKADSEDRISYHTDTRIPKVDVDKLNKYGIDLGQERFNYITDPTEIEARKMSTLYFMNKSLGKDIKSGKISGSDLDELYNMMYNSGGYNNSKNTLPLDTQDLLELYKWQKDDLLKYLNNNFNYDSKKNGGWLKKYQDAGQVMTYASNPDYFDSHAVYHDNPKANDLIRSKVYAGTHGWDPVNKALIKLDKPVFVPESTRERATEEWGKKSYKERFESNTPAGREVREAAVKNSMQAMVKNPLLYAPGAAAATVFGAPIVGPALGTLMEAPMVVAGTTVPGVTVGSTLGALGAGMSTQQLLDPTSVTRQSINVAYENPNTENVLTAVGEVGLTGLGYVGLGIGNGITQGASKGYDFLNKQSQSIKRPLNEFLKSKQGIFAAPYKQGVLSNTLSPEEFSRLRQLDEGMSLLAYNNPNREDLIREFVNKSSLNDDELIDIFGRTRSELLAPKTNVTPSEPASTRINLSRPTRESSTQLPPPPAEIDISGTGWDQIQGGPDLSVPAYLRRNIDISNLPQPEYRDIIGTLQDVITNSDIYDPQVVQMARNFLNEEVTLKDLVKGLFKQPIETSYAPTVPSLSARSFTNKREMLGHLKNQIETGIQEAPIGSVITGSTNTSYNSYLPQMDYIFKNAGTQGLSKPVFLGYKPMNNAGFLSDTKTSPEDVLKFINTSLNKIQKRTNGKLNLSSNPPYINSNGDIMLPQYGVRKLDNSFTKIKKQDGGWLSSYQDGGNANFDASYLTSNTQWTKAPEGNWMMGMQDGGIMKLQNAEKKRINTAAKGFNDYIINVTLSKSGGSAQGNWLNKYK